MAQVIINLEFEDEEVTMSDVVNYLNELIEDGSLSATVVDEDGEYVTSI